MTVHPALDLLARCRSRMADGATPPSTSSATTPRPSSTRTARPFTFITRPRGGRKTTDGAGFAVALHLTVAPPGSRSYVVAADSDQAALVLDSIRAFVARERTLRKRIKVERSRVVFLSDGEPTSSVEVLPADEASSWGLRPFLVICDELSVWPNTENARGLWSAVVSAMPKVEGSRLVVVTSAGAPDHWSATSPRARQDITPMASV